MISTATVLAILKSQASFAALAAAIINYAMAERARQYDLVREMGTLACEIENAKLLGQECSHLQKQYEQLEKLVEV